MILEGKPQRKAEADGGRRREAGKRSLVRRLRGERRAGRARIWGFGGYTGALVKTIFLSGRNARSRSPIIVIVLLGDGARLPLADGVLLPHIARKHWRNQTLS